MDIAIFLKELREDTEKFAIYWFANMREDPDKYPTKLSDADWIEQFITWREMQKTDDTGCASEGEG